MWLGGSEFALQSEGPGSSRRLTYHVTIASVVTEVVLMRKLTINSNLIFFFKEDILSDFCYLLCLTIEITHRFYNRISFSITIDVLYVIDIGQQIHCDFIDTLNTLSLNCITVKLNL